MQREGHQNVAYLIRRHVVQNDADGLGRIEPGWHRDQLALRQADELRLGTVDRQRGEYLSLRN